VLDCADVRYRAVQKWSGALAVAARPQVIRVIADARICGLLRTPFASGLNGWPRFAG
jgi:hypothetical protein